MRTMHTVGLYSIKIGLIRGVHPYTPYEIVDGGDDKGVTYYFTCMMARNKDVLIEHLKGFYGKNMLRDSLRIDKFATLKVENPSNIIPITQEQYDTLFKKKEDDNSPIIYTGETA